MTESSVRVESPGELGVRDASVMSRGSRYQTASAGPTSNEHRSRNCQQTEESGDCSSGACLDYSAKQL